MGKKVKCYDIQDIVKRIPKSTRIVDEKTYGHTVKKYFQNLIDVLMQYSEVVMPYGMGNFRKTIVDMTPYYDTKTGKTVGGMRVPRYLDRSFNISNKFIKISYYKSSLKFNPLRFCTFYKGEYLKKKLYEMYQSNDFNSLYYKKI